MSEGGTEAATAAVEAEGATDVDVVGAIEVDVVVDAVDVDVVVGAMDVVVGVVEIVVGEIVFRMAGVDVVEKARAGFGRGGVDPGASAITSPTITATAADAPKRAPGRIRLFRSPGGTRRRCLGPPSGSDNPWRGPFEWAPRGAPPTGGFKSRSTERLGDIERDGGADGDFGSGLRISCGRLRRKRRSDLLVDVETRSSKGRDRLCDRLIRDQRHFDQPRSPGHRHFNPGSDRNAGRALSRGGRDDNPFLNTV